MNKNSLIVNKKTLQTPIIIWIVFVLVAVLFGKLKGSVFLIFNFIYIGTSIAIGIFLGTGLPKKSKSIGRKITQLMVGLYMLVFIGFVSKENIQIEGFFMLFSLGMFGGAVIHYLVAKIAGPLIFNRGWCGYACWTAMLLDFLPFTRPKEKRRRYFGLFRYLHFFLSLGLIFVMWKKGEVFGFENTSRNVLWLVIGNLFYFISGVLLALFLKDNRAFCKYLCPIPVFQKVTSRFSLMKIKIDKDKCINCGLCEKDCPMNIKLLAYKKHNKRILSTECILCSTCVYVCTQNAAKINFGFDVGMKEEINYRERRKKLKTSVSSVG